MELIEQVRAKIIEAVPDIRSVSDGRIGKGSGYCRHGWWCICSTKDEYYLRPITLADVLRAIPKHALELNLTAHFLYANYIGTQGQPPMAWNLALPLDEQEPEVIEFLAHVLGITS